MPGIANDYSQEIFLISPDNKKQQDGISEEAEQMKSSPDNAINKTTEEMKQFGGQDEFKANMMAAHERNMTDIRKNSKSNVGSNILEFH